MNAPLERILVVENDPEVSRLISRQILQPLGYQVAAVTTAAAAIQEISKNLPELLIVDLNLPELSGKDLLVALSSQAIELPAIMVAREGGESDIIQSFRLGASDYLCWPARETEVASVVERVLGQVRSRREQKRLTLQLNQANQELQRNVRELGAIFALGKAVSSLTYQPALLEKIVKGATDITEADSGWLLLRKGQSNTFLLCAQQNLPERIAGRVNQTWDDGLTSLVGISGESLCMYGKPLRRFKISRLGQSVLVVPIKVKQEVIGLLVVMRRTAHPFSPHNQALLEAAADYVSISFVNAQLFKALEERAPSLHKAADAAQNNERVKNEISMKISPLVIGPLQEANDILSSLLGGENDPLNAIQKNLLRTTQEKIQDASQSLAAMLKQDRKVAVLAVDDRQALSPNELSVTHLKELGRIQSDFVNTISHDLRSPLTAILGYAELINRVGPVNPQQKEFIQQVQLNVHSIIDLINDLLGSGRIDC